MNRKRLLVVLALIAGTIVGTASASVDADGFVRLTPDEIKFTGGENGGPMTAVIAGDPNKPGLYIIRAKFPPGVFSTPHYHTTARHVTVIKGTWYTGTGSKFDRDNTVALGPGSYMMHPAGAIHYDGAKDEEVIVEIKGIGPVKTVRLKQ